MEMATSPASAQSLQAHRNRPLQAAILMLYAFATLQFVRFYTVSTTFYLDLPAYLSGHERMPFQKRILPAVLINGFRRLTWLHPIALHTQGAFTANKAPIYVIALVSVCIAGCYTQRLYGLLTSGGALYFLVYPMFLFSLLWAYAMHMEANFAYPYDMPSVAFFSAGLYFIYARRFLPLVVVITIGTFNRETTLFLIGIYLLDSMSGALRQDGDAVAIRQRIRSIPWLRLALLLSIWLFIQLLLDHIFASNSRAEDYRRIHENVGRLKLRLVPALLNICGYMLPIVLLLQGRIRPMRFRSYLLIVPVWLAIMFYTGVILETRIYGELCPYVAVALVLIIERQVLARKRAVSHSSPVESSFEQPLAP